MSSELARSRKPLAKIELWLSIIFFCLCGGMLGTLFGLNGLGLIVGGILSFIVLAIVLRRSNLGETERRTSSTPQIRRISRFSIGNIIWGPLSLLAGGMIYCVISYFSDPLLAPSPHDIWLSISTDRSSIVVGLFFTLKYALNAFTIGVAASSTIALCIVLIRDPNAAREGFSIPSLAWLPVLVSAIPFFYLTVGNKFV